MAFDDTDGSHWRYCNATRDDPCSCGRAGGYGVGVGCTAGHITSLSLFNTTTFALPGAAIPASFGALSALTVLDLGYNGMEGVIPEQIYALTNLTHLYLQGNRLSGTISPSIGALTALTKLIVNDNRLAGSFPASVSALALRSSVRIDGNELSGAFPALNYTKVSAECTLLFSGGGNRFDCPVPADALRSCHTCAANSLHGGCTSFGNLTAGMCFTAPAPASHSPAGAVAGSLCAVALLAGAALLWRKKGRHVPKSGGAASAAAGLGGGDMTMPLLGGVDVDDLPHTSTHSLAAPAAAAAPRNSRNARYTSAQIERATDGFAERLKLAEGAFGAVYKGNMQGRAVAIKVLTNHDASGGGGAHAAAAAEGAADYSGAGSFALEAKVLGQYRHMNIVELVGHCLDEGASRYLIYEFMEGGSLRERLDARQGTAALTWPERLCVASDVARGLEFLHVDADPPIIHQDVKSDNILLTVLYGQVVAKLADFGAVRIAPTLLTDKTHMSVKSVIGTKPYQPNEYVTMGHVSEKTDAFAFGVVLLELLTGLPPSNKETNEFLYSEMHPVLERLESALPPLLDARAGALRKRSLKKSVVALARIAKKCLVMFARERCTVSDVLVQLDVLAGRQAIRRAGRGEEYDHPMTGKLVKTADDANGQDLRMMGVTRFG